MRRGVHSGMSRVEVWTPIGKQSRLDDGALSRGRRILSRGSLKAEIEERCRSPFVGEGEA